MLSNLRLSFRTLARSRGFALIAVLTLAVGIGATTAIFSALQALVISPFSYPASRPSRPCLVRQWLVTLTCRRHRPQGPGVELLRVRGLPAADV